MATGLLSHTLLHHSDTHHTSHRAPSCSSSLHGHVLHAVPHPCKAVCRAVEGIPGASSAQQHAQHQHQHNASSPLACAGHMGGHHMQQHRGSPPGAAGGNWALASAPPGPALGWNAAFFSNYRLGEKMGSGSFGTVHRAVHLLTGNSYAVKVLQKGGTHNRGMQLDAIQREVDTWQEAQNSSYVAKLEGLFEDEHNAYIVQELCTGGSLHEHLTSKGTCSEPEAANIMQGVLDLLVELHRRSICYGDLKPANIMFSGSLQVRAIDFGCSRSARGRALTQACGSPVYAAPEIAQQRYGVGVDVWSAGVLLYQMLTGRLPFWPGKTMEQVAKLPAYEVLAGARTLEVQFPRSLWAGISPEAQDLVSGMLDRNPATRISAADALQHPWLSSVLGYTPVPSGDSPPGVNHVLEFKPRASPPRPAPVPLSPCKAGASLGPLSPQKPSPLRSMLSGELPTGVLLPDMLRGPMPAMVPAAE